MNVIETAMSEKHRRWYLLQVKWFDTILYLLRKYEWCDCQERLPKSREWTIIWTR